MSCALCSSLNEAECATQIIIHPGLKHLDDPGVFVAPKVLVCMDCGASRPSTPVNELWLLRGAAA